MPADPVPDGAVRQAGVSLLVASGEVGDLGTIDYPLGHAVAWDRTLPASAVAIATSCVLVVVATVDLLVQCMAILVGTGCYCVSLSCYCLVLGNTASV